MTSRSPRTTNTSENMLDLREGREKLLGGSYCLHDIVLAINLEYICVLDLKKVHKYL